MSRLLASQIPFSDNATAEGDARAMWNRCCGEALWAISGRQEVEVFFDPFREVDIGLRAAPRQILRLDLPGWVAPEDGDCGLQGRT